MLNHIKINNFAIIDELDLEIPPQLSVITGETGAGKSIIFDALGLAMGHRADSTTVRHGADKADVLASFDLKNNPDAQKWLSERDLDCDRECILRRIVSKDGRSRSYINGRPSTLQDLRELGSLLVNIHGQHEHQALLKKETHQHLLDNFANATALVKQTAERYRAWQKQQQYLDQLRHNLTENNDRAELLTYQVEELDALNFQEGELQTLETEHACLANADKTLENCQQTLNLLSAEDDSSLVDQLNQAQRFLEQTAGQDEALKQSIEMINSAAIQIDEAANTLRHYIDSFEADPARFQELDLRLSTVYQLARKHKTTPESLPELHRQLAEELENLSGGDEKLAFIEKECEILQAHYLESAHKLSSKRSSAAKKLAKGIEQHIHQLGMPHGKCQVALTPTAPTAHGLEAVEFLVTANAGQPLKPLTKVASGGELSRISLAIQVICAEKSDLGTICFDEVDVGISGGIAEVVGKLLRKLGERSQVICVTHLPQVAAQGHQHLHVNKQIRRKLTHTKINTLNQDEKVLEIARLLGGIEITDQTIAHAKEMVASA